MQRGVLMLSLSHAHELHSGIAYLINVTKFYKTDPNRTSGKIKLTPPVDSYTIY